MLVLRNQERDSDSEEEANGETAKNNVEKATTSKIDENDEYQFANYDAESTYSGFKDF